MCLIETGNVEEAAQEVERFIREFPHAGDMTMLKAARERVNRARHRRGTRGEQST
jgi:hypothetical protein